jgi:hypothetical protein
MRDTDDLIFCPALFDGKLPGDSEEEERECTFEFVRLGEANRWRLGCYYDGNFSGLEECESRHREEGGSLFLLDLLISTYFL